MICFELVDFPKIILIGRRICDHNWEYSPCNIQNYELIFIYQGEACFTIDDEQIPAQNGDCVLLKPGQVFSARTNPQNPCKYYIIHFQLNCQVERIRMDFAAMQIKQAIKSYNYKEMKDIFEMPQIEFKKIYLLQKCFLGNYKSTIFKILEKAITERNQLTISSELMITSYLCEILILLSRLTFESLKIEIVFSHGNTIPRIIQEAIFYIHYNYMKHISLKDICGHLNVSPQYLIRCFKSTLHKTPIQYINLFRVSRAKDLLKYTTLSIKEITFEVGIDNPYYFYRLFKKIVNMTPTEFRNLASIDDDFQHAL